MQTVGSIQRRPPAGKTASRKWFSPRNLVAIPPADAPPDPGLSSGCPPAGGGGTPTLRRASRMRFWRKKSSRPSNSGNRWPTWESLGNYISASFDSGGASARNLVFRAAAGAVEALRGDLLWAEMPADTRCPDHSIWDHMRVTTALAFLTGNTTRRRPPGTLAAAFRASVQYSVPSKTRVRLVTYGSAPLPAL